MKSNHMLRAVQVSHGGLVGRRFEASAGGSSDMAIDASLHAIQALNGNPDRKVTNREIQDANTPWSDLRDVYYPNTAQYPPFFYMPAALSVVAGREAGLRVSTTLRLARMVNGLCAAMLGAIALRIAQATRLMIAAVLTLPMTLNLAAAVGQDGLLISAMCACVAAIDYLASRTRTPTFSEIGVISAALTFVAMAKPPLVAVAALLLLLPGRDRRYAISASIVVATIACVWSLFVAATISVPMNGADAPAQLSYMLRHPARLPSLAIETLRIHSDGYWREFVGQLGWLDVSLPDFYVRTDTGVLALAFLSGGAAYLKHRRLVASILLVSTAGIFVALYLTWTSPGASDVQGIQGRYFLPLAPVMALLAPNIPRVVSCIRPVALFAVVALAAVTPMIVLRALVVRYYLVA